MHAVLRQGTVLGTFYREVRGMRDGGCIALDWWRAGGGPPDEAAPVVLILHGITGTLPPPGSPQLTLPLINPPGLRSIAPLPLSTAGPWPPNTHAECFEREVNVVNARA